MALAIDAVVGGVLFAISPTVVAFALMVAGLVGVVALAVVNGTWMHGAPAWRHHIVRAAVALVVVVSGALVL